jgi:hypothetical protein
MPKADPSAGKPRGRPPGALYASENSIPQGDPLMAALLEGIHSDELAMPKPLIEAGLPPVRTTDPGVAPPSQRRAWRAGRVVPPSRGRRKTTNSTRNDPRGRQIATHPEELNTMRRVGISDPEMPDVSGRMSSPPGEVRSERMDAVTAPIPLSSDDPVAPVRSLRDPAAEQPPAPPARPAAPHQEPERRPPVVTPGPASTRWSPPTPAAQDRVDRRWVGVMVFVGVVLLIGVLGANAALQRKGQVRAIERTLDAGIGPNGPVPALPQDVDRLLDALDLRRRVLSRTQEILGRTERFTISVEVRQRVFGLPLSYRVSREGECDIGSMISTMEFYRTGGWNLDQEAQDLLAEYKAASSSRTVEPEFQVPELEEDSGAAVPSTNPDEQDQGEGEGEQTPAPTP